MDGGVDQGLRGWLLEWDPAIRWQALQVWLCAYEVHVEEALSPSVHLVTRLSLQ